MSYIGKGTDMRRGDMNIVVLQFSAWVEVIRINPAISNNTGTYPSKILEVFD